MNKSLQTFIAVLNTFLEWTEYSLYLYLGNIISQQFFPAQSAEAALILTYGLFATAYFFRPLGALGFGYFSDKIGRKPPMIFAMILMGLATLGIGVMPTYASVGIWAPILLLLCRMMQSVAVSGEYQSAAIYLMEHDPRPFAGSLIMAASCAGIFLGGFTVSLLSRYGLSADYWRWPFVLAGGLGLGLSILRYRLLETPVFSKLKQSNRLAKNPIQSIFQYPKQLLKIISVAAFVCIFVYILNGYYAGFLARYTSLSSADAYLYCALCELGVAILAPVIAYKLDVTTNIRCLLLGTIGLAFTGFVMFHAAISDSTPYILSSLVLFTVFDAMVTASIAYYLFIQLPAEIKCTGIGVSWNISAALFGGTAPMIAEKMVTNGYPMTPAWYVLLAAMIASSVLYRQLNSISRQYHAHAREMVTHRVS